MIEDSVHIIMNLVKVLTLSLPVTIVVIYFSCLLMLPIVQTIWTQIRLLPWSGFILFASMKNLALNALEYMQQTQKADNSALFFSFFENEYPLYKQCTSRSYGSVVIPFNLVLSFIFRSKRQLEVSLRILKVTVSRHFLWHHHHQGEDLVLTRQQTSGHWLFVNSTETTKSRERLVWVYVLLIFPCDRVNLTMC